MIDPLLTDDLMWPSWFRWVVIAGAMCILCSCRALPQPDPGCQAGYGTGCQATLPTGSYAPAEVDLGGPSAAACGISASAYPTAAPGGHCQDHAAAVDPIGYAATGPSAACQADYQVAGPWRPPGIAPPWPQNEYLCDGGDFGPRSTVRADRSIGPLDLEDTVARYEADDGRTLVTASNRVCVYAPRFGAVRQVASPVEYDTRDLATAVDLPEQLSSHAGPLPANTTLQRLQPRGERGTRAGSVYRGRQQGGGLETRIRLAAMNDALLPYENLQIIRLGRYDQNEKARLAQAVVAAIVWTKDQPVQVILDEQRAEIATGDAQVEVVYRVDTPENPRLRIVKIASNCTAQPGETVDFTIRYDNVGDQTIRTVTLLDNLTTRLEFVPGSARSSQASDFSTAPNDGGSLLLRWDLTTPLEPGAGGMVRFRCKVR